MNTGVAPQDMRYDESMSAVVIGDDPAATGLGRDAVAAAGARLANMLPLASGATWLADAAGPDVILIETANADLAAVGATLDAIDALARDRGSMVIVAMAEGDVDQVAASIFGPHARLLDRPTIDDRALELQLASRARRARLHDSTRDADERLRRLNEEVARFAETLANLGGDHDPARFAQVRDTGLGFRAESSDEPIGKTDAGEVRDLIRARRMRGSFFTGDLFADPAWDMLLDLFAAQLEHRRVSVSSLCIAAAVPGTTALRWIGSLVETGLFERYADPHDRRRAFITLSAKAIDAMQRYFHAVRRAGLVPA